MILKGVKIFMITTSIQQAMIECFVDLFSFAAPVSLAIALAIVIIRMFIKGVIGRV